MAKCSKIDANRFRHRITVQSKADTDDGAGGIISEAYSTRFQAWAAIDPARGVEEYEQKQQRQIISHKITLRYQSGMTIKDQIVFGSRTFGIIEIINVEERNEFLEVLAVENTRA